MRFTHLIRVPPPVAVPVGRREIDGVLVGELGIRVSALVNDQGVKEAHPGSDGRERVFGLAHPSAVGATGEAWSPLGFTHVGARAQTASRSDDFPTTDVFSLLLHPAQVDFTALTVHGLPVKLLTSTEATEWAQSEGDNPLQGLAFPSVYFVSAAGSSLVPSVDGHRLMPRQRDGEAIGKLVTTDAGELAARVVNAQTTFVNAQNRGETQHCLSIVLAGAEGSAVPMSKLRNAELVVTRQGAALGRIALNTEVLPPRASQHGAWYDGFGDFTAILDARALRGLADGEALRLRLQYTNAKGERVSVAEEIVLPAAVIQSEPTTGFNVYPFDEGLR